MRKKDSIVRLNILVICLIIIWTTLQRTVLEGFDGRGRLVLLLTLVLFVNNLLVNSSYRRTLVSKQSVFKFWFIWFIYAVLNTIFNYSLKELPLDAFLGLYLFTPFVVMSIIASMSYKYLSLFLKWLGITVYLSFILFFITSDIQGGRFVVERFDPNEFSLIIYLLIVLIGLATLLKKITKLQTLLLLLLPVYFAIMLGSRMGFIGVLLLLLGLFVVSAKKGKIVSIRKLFVIAGLSIIPIIYVVNNTVLGERLMASTKDSKNLTENYAEGTVFEKFGDRGLYYVLGWEAFKDEPLTGIGLRNFQHNYYYTVMHSEFMIQLAELGIIGIFLYLLFVISLFKTLNKVRKSIRLSIPLYNYLFFVLCVLMLSSSVLFVYPSLAAAIIYGLLLFFIKKDTLIYLK